MDVAPEDSNEDEIPGVTKVNYSNKTPPKGYPSDKKEYGDPENYKYPLDTDARIRSAMAYFNASGQRSAGGYSSEQWAAIGKRIASAANRAFGPGHRYSNGKIMMNKMLEAQDLLQKSNDGKNVNKLLEDLISAIADKIQVSNLQKAQGGDFEKVDTQALQSILDVLKTAFGNVEELLNKAGVMNLNSENASDTSVNTSASLPGAESADNAVPGKIPTGQDASADLWAAPPGDSNVLPHMSKSEGEEVTTEEVATEETITKSETPAEETVQENGEEMLKTFVTDELGKLTNKTVEALENISKGMESIAERVERLENSGAGKKSGEVNEELSKANKTSFWGGSFFGNS